MKRGFKTLVAAAVWTVLSATYIHPAWATVRKSNPAAAKIDDQELKLRFLAALARAREPQKVTMLERQRLGAMQLVEKQVGLNLGVARMIEDASARDPNLKMSYSRGNRAGIGKRLREATKLTFDEAGKKMGSSLKLNSTDVPTQGLKPLPEMQMAGFFLLAGALIDECRPDEPQANRAFLKHIAAQPWPEGQGKMILAFLVSGLLQNGCITRAEFDQIYKPLVPSIRQRAVGTGATPGSMAGTMFFLLATDQFHTISEAQLQTFVRAQSADGSWADEIQKADASAFAAFGAAVISEMLKSRGIKVGADEVKAAYAKPPVLPGQKSTPSTP